MHKIEYDQKIQFFQEEKKKYDLNRECEAKLLITHNRLLDFQTIQQYIKKEEIATTGLTFVNVLANLTEEHFGKDKREGSNASSRLTRPQLSAFIQVRQPIAKYRGIYP